MLTTVLDLLGALLLILAVAVLAWPLSAPGALAASGACVLLVSWIADWKRGRS